MKTTILTLFMCLLLTPLFRVQAQFQFHNECNDEIDFGGTLTAGFPSHLDFDEAYLEYSTIMFRGCLWPGGIDYNDLFYFHVPLGYQITEIRFNLNTSTSSGLDVHFWNGPQCLPLDSPDHSSLDNGVIWPDDPPGGNIIAGFGPLTTGYYAARITHHGLPGTTIYRLQFTFECTDNVPPVFTSAAGSLNATLSCSDGVGLGAALDLEPTGTDNIGNTTVTLTDDYTVVDPGCPNAYIRTRSWQLVDACGNVSANEFIQTITVEDDGLPQFTTPPGLLDVTVDCSDAAGLAAALNIIPWGVDNCGNTQASLISDSTIPDPECPQSYVRIRTWFLEDECGHESLDFYTQTITVQDLSIPQWTTAAGSLDVAGIECSDFAAIAAANAMTPIGTDECGTASAVVISDQIFPDPQCPNAYERYRVWALVDECGNVAAGIRTQSITVVDNTGPVVVPSDGTIAIYDIAGYELLLEDLLEIGSSYDACGGELSLVSADPLILTCDDLGQIIPVEFVVSDVCGNTTVAISNIEVTQDLSIKPPWDHNDIGATADGDALHYVCEEEYHIWSDGQASPNADVAHFVYVELCGDGELIGRVQQVDLAGGYAGVMIRENLAQGSIKMALKKSSSISLRRDIRMNTNGIQSTFNTNVSPAPLWMRITRAGNVITLYTSVNGTDWTFRGTAQPNLGDCVLWGLYTESSLHNHVVTGVFDNVSITGDVQPIVEARPLFTDISAQQGISVKENLTVYPNPGQGLFNVDISGFNGQNVQIEVYTADGRLIFGNSFLAENKVHEINIQNHPPGIYVLKVIPAEGLPITTKLMSIK